MVRLDEIYMKHRNNKLFLRKDLSGALYKLWRAEWLAECIKHSSSMFVNDIMGKYIEDCKKDVEKYAK